MTRIVAVMMLCLALLFAGVAVARADDSTVFCAALDVNHSPAAVMHAIGRILDEGYDSSSTIAIVDDALTNVCPRHVDDVVFAVAVYKKGMRV